MFANDLKRGLDVYRYVPSKAATTRCVTWLDAEQAADRPSLELALGQRIPYCAVAP